MTRTAYPRSPAREVARAGDEAYPPARSDAAPRTPRRRDDTGTVPLELVIVLPILAILLAILVLAWRVSEAGNQVTAAAAEAARAASLERDVSASAAAGEEAARRTLEDRGLACTDLDVSLDVSSYEPGGHVTATVSCTAQLSDLDVPGAPGSWTTEASFTEPIEQYRGG
jgi:Flp pilus assembly protein TadG